MPLVRLKTVAAAAGFVATFIASSSAHAQAAPAAAAPPGAAATVPATNPAAVDAEIDALLKQLASDDWPTRLAAQNRLAGLGELAEPRLKRVARESDDAEVRARCEAALHQIADNRLAGPTLITMSVHQVHPRIVFQEIERQAGIELKPQSPSLWTQPLPQVTLEVTREPLWDVIRRVREQCGLDLEPWNAGVAVTRVPAGADKAPTMTHGPFRLRATRVARSYAVDLASGGVAVNEFAVTLTLQAEPKLRISSALPVARVETAEDENGLSLLPGAAGEAGAGAGAGAAIPQMRVARVVADLGGRGGIPLWTVTARLEYPPQGAGKRIARLKGAATCNVVVRTETLEVPDILKAENLTKEVGGSDVTIRGCRKVGNRYDLVLSMSSDAFARAGPQALAFRALRGGGGSHAAIRLVDTTGRDMTQQGATRMTTHNDRLDVTLSFGAGGPGPVAVVMPSKLVWQVPTEVREVEVPFEFTDLPLP